MIGKFRQVAYAICIARLLINEEKEVTVLN
jgi:hypothetical protein